MDDLVTYELVIDENEKDEVFAISLVDDPAIETDFMFFNAVEQTQNELKFSTVDKERRIVAGAVLIPDMEILRKDENDEYYNVFFSKETVESLAHQFVKNKRSDNVTLQHAMMANGISLIESWVVADPDKDKSQTFGFELSEGTWFAIFKIDNDDVWENFVKTGKLRGFSVEVKISKVKQQLKKEDNMSNEKKVDTETITTDEKSKFMSILERFEALFTKNEKEEKMEDKEDKKEEKMEDEKTTEEMVTVAVPEPLKGEIFIPEDLTDEKVEVEANDKKFVVHVYVKEMEPVEQSDTDNEPANPDEVVVDEFSKVKAELAELKQYINDAQTVEKFTKKVEGDQPKTDGELNAQEIMAFAKKGMAQ
jgi:hypothetical protein